MKKLSDRTTDISGLESGQADIENKIDTVQVSADTIDGKVDAVKTDTESIGTKSNTIISDVSVVDGKVDGVQVDTTAILIDTGSTESKVDAVKVDTVSIEGKSDAIILDIAAAEVKIDAVKVDTVAIEGKVDAANINIATIDGKTDTVILDIATADGKIDTVKTDTESIEGKVDLVQADTTQIDGKCDTITADISGVDGKIDALQSDTTIIKSDSAKSKAGTDYIVDLATGGLGTTTDSLAYGVAEIERHLHSYERWYGAANSPSAPTHVADELGSDAGAFVLTAGNNDFGLWVQVLGSGDTPFAPGQEFYDLHRLSVESATGSDTFIIQISFGDSGAAGIASKTYSTVPFIPATNQIDSWPLTIQVKRQPSGTKVWARCKRNLQNGGTVGIYPGIHEYEG